MPILKEIGDTVFVLAFWALVIFWGLLIVSAPTAAAYFIHRWLKKTRFRIVGLLLLTAAPLWTVYMAYTAVYPTDSFYLSEFETATLREAPMSAIVVRKDASYPDFHGDYCSTSLIRMSEFDYAQLLDEVSKDSRFELVKPEEVMGDRELKQILGEYDVKDLAQCYRHHWSEDPRKSFMVGFLNERRSVVVYVIRM